MIIEGKNLINELAALYSSISKEPSKQKDRVSVLTNVDFIFYKEN